MIGNNQNMPRRTAVLLTTAIAIAAIATACTTPANNPDPQPATNHAAVVGAASKLCPTAITATQLDNWITLATGWTPGTHGTTLGVGAVSADNWRLHATAADDPNSPHDGAVVLARQLCGIAHNLNFYLHEEVLAAPQAAQFDIPQPTNPELSALTWDAFLRGTSATMKAGYPDFTTHPHADTLTAILTTMD